MSFDPQTLVRENIRRLTPYRSARQDHSRGVLLDANENAFGSTAGADGLELNRYPDPFMRELREALAALHGLRAAQLFVGVGSDEAIDLLFRVFCEPGRDSCVVTEPTYGMYRVSAGINDVAVRSVQLGEGFDVPVDRVLAAAEAGSKLIFFCSPNNPTANLLSPDAIRRVCRSTRALVVVDEAYQEFAEADSLAGEAGPIPNLVVLRTLSKAWGLAGIRLGWCAAAEWVIEYLLRVKSPYNVNALTARAALEGLRRQDRMHHMVAAIRAERNRLASSLASIPLVRRVFPSDANFLLVRVQDADALHTRLADRGIIVRNRSREPMLEGCLRITVGTPPENAELLATLRQIAEEGPA